MIKKELQNLVGIYGFNISRVNELHQAVYTDLKFYAGIIVALIGGTIFLLKEELKELPNQSSVFSAITLIIAGILVYGASKFGRKGVNHSYSAWLRTVSTLVKIENDLGLTDPKIRDFSNQKEQVWPEEPYIFPAYWDEWKLHSGSISFVETRKNMGYAQTAGQLFFATKIFGFLFFIGGLFELIRVICLLFYDYKFF